MKDFLILHAPAEFIGQESPYYQYGDHQIRIAFMDKMNDHICDLACCKCGCMVRITGQGVAMQPHTILTVPAFQEFQKRVPSSCKDAENYAEVCMIMEE